jgi:hypothetical protein
MNTWEAAKYHHRVGTGNWEAWNCGLEPIFDAAEDWKSHLSGIAKPWLCWNLDDKWCQVQQKLVLGIGWTPIVGNDTGVEAITLLDGSVYVDFNKILKLPSMWMHFVIEFAFLFAERLAFWHSDLLCSREAMARYATVFTDLKDGEMAAVKHLHGWFGFRDRHKNHYGELLACTTRGASRSQFTNGCGWWRHIECHPNYNKVFHKGQSYYYEHGVGIWIWNKKFGGHVRVIKVNEKDGHCSAYLQNLPKLQTKQAEMNNYCDLVSIASNLGIENLLP